MSQNYSWPPGFAVASNPSVGTTGSPAPSSATEVAGVDGGTILRPLSVDSTGKLNVNISSVSPSPLPVQDAAAEASLASIDGKVSTSALQTAGNASLSSIDSKLNSLGQEPMAASMPVAIASDQSILSVADSAAEASLTSIDGKLNSLGQKAMAASMPVVIASDQSPVPVSISSGISNPLPVQDSAAEASLASIDSNIAARLTGSLVPTAFDEIDLTYVPSGPGAGQIQTAVYKLASVTQKTLTLSYDGSDRLSSVVAS